MTTSLLWHFPIETDKKAAKIVTPSLLRAHNAALRLHPSGLIALRAFGFTLSLLSFFPFFLLEKCFLRQAGEQRKQTKNTFINF